MIDVPYEVKHALKDGRLKKNYRIIVLNDDGTEDFTIDNETLVYESVNIDERLCSGDVLKFGLCEGSSIEFQYFNHPNIYGRRIQVFVDVEYVKESYENVGTLSSDGSDYRYDVLVAGDYRIYIEPSEVENVRATSSVSVANDDDTNYYDMVVMPDGHGEVLLPGCTTTDMIYLYAAFGKEAHSIVQRKPIPYSIPMGFFDVKKCSRQASTGIMKVTAYNKLMSEYLDAKANDLIAETPSDMSDGSTTLFSILEKTLNDYGINNRTETELSVFIQHYQGGSYSDTTGVSISINGHSGTYFPSIYETYDYYCRVTTTIPEGSMLLLDLTEFVGLLQRSVIGMKTAFYNNVVNAESKWNSAVQDFGMLQNTACMEVGFYNDIYAHFYTLPSEVRTDPSAHNHPIRSVMNLYNVQTLSFVIPYRLYAAKSGHTNDILLWTNSESFNIDVLDKKLKMIMANELIDAELINVDVNNLPDVTLRELQSAVYETVCQFGQLSRETDLFSGVELNQGGLYPAEDLYPANDLYPSGAALSATKAMYSQLWADEGNRRKWRYLIITYKGLDEEDNEADFTLQRTVNADGTDDYNMSDNWLFRNLVWTAEQVGDYADAMVTKMQNNEWFPFEMWCAGLPYLETGDQIEIPLNGEVYKSYILQRQLKGIQNLQDTYINGTLDIF